MTPEIQKELEVAEELIAPVLPSLRFVVKAIARASQVKTELVSVSQTPGEGDEWLWEVKITYPFIMKRGRKIHYYTTTAFAVSLSLAAQEAIQNVNSDSTRVLT